MHCLLLLIEGDCHSYVPGKIVASGTIRLLCHAVSECLSYLWPAQNTIQLCMLPSHSRLCISPSLHLVYRVWPAPNGLVSELLFMQGQWRLRLI